MRLDFPFHFDARGRTARTTEADHVRDLITQVLFTSPGERVNRPDFGCGLKQLVFAPNSNELAAATQALVQGSLQQWLGELIQVERVEASADEAKLEVSLTYVLRSNGERRTDSFEIEAAGP
jgi:phage baseplate assembly protein W